MPISIFLLTRLWPKASCWSSCLGPRTISGGRLRARLPSLSDNVGAESVINRLYTSKQPLALFVQRLAIWACAHAVSLNCSHVSGERNKEADALSRRDESCPIPCSFQEADRAPSGTFARSLNLCLPTPSCFGACPVSQAPGARQRQPSLLTCTAPCSAAPPPLGHRWCLEHSLLLRCGAVKLALFWHSCADDRRSSLCTSLQ